MKGEKTNNDEQNGNTLLAVQIHDAFSKLRASLIGATHGSSYLATHTYHSYQSYIYMCVCAISIQGSSTTPFEKKQQQARFQPPNHFPRLKVQEIRCSPNFKPLQDASPVKSEERVPSCEDFANSWLQMFQDIERHGEFSMQDESWNIQIHSNMFKVFQSNINSMSSNGLSSFSQQKFSKSDSPGIPLEPLPLQSRRRDPTWPMIMMI